MLELFILPTFAIAIIFCWIATSALAFASIFSSGKFENWKDIEQDVLTISHVSFRFLFRKFTAEWSGWHSDENF